MRANMVGLLVAAALVAFGCESVVDGPTVGTESGRRPLPELNVSNQTTIAVRVVVNGREVAVLEPGAVLHDLVIDAIPMPWLVQLTTATRRVLLDLAIEQDAVLTTTGPDGQVSTKGQGARVDLSCGRLEAWVGPPLLGPPPGRGTLGDCDP